ncbi:hypothetical protein XU18_4896 [Perkinsela sp. CCAP 1560/4]|nr:hypothetical protein XU18_4896 [Perkinsela sp. CCAP 1560/4]|eukprot:KNH03820.1 hypothetical protein XU18_4896 [Perkinsela sp. CCAP 1560/4]
MRAEVPLPCELELKTDGSHCIARKAAGSVSQQLFDDSLTNRISQLHADLLLLRGELDLIVFHTMQLAIQSDTLGTQTDEILYLSKQNTENSGLYSLPKFPG